MPSPNAVKLAFAALEAAGLRPPDALGTEIGWRAAVGLWERALRDLDDRALEAAVDAYVSQPDARWWPSPGQLLALVTVDGPSGHDAFGRLLECVRQHAGRAEPLEPGAPEPWSLHPSREEAQARWEGIEAAGGWRVLASATDRSEHRARFVAAYERAVDFGRQQHERAAWRRRWLPSQGTPWHETADAGRAWQAVVAAVATRGVDCPPLRPGALARFRLADDPATEAAMWAGLAALGGWETARSIPHGRHLDPDAVRAQDAQRWAFRSAYDAAAGRAAKADRIDVSRQIEARRHLRLAAGGDR